MSYSSPRYIVEVRTFGVWRPYVSRGTGKVCEFVYRAFAETLAERLKTVHNLETQVTLK